MDFGVGGELPLVSLWFLPSALGGSALQSRPRSLWEPLDGQVTPASLGAGVCSDRASVPGLREHERSGLCAGSRALCPPWTWARSALPSAVRCHTSHAALFQSDQLQRHRRVSGPCQL